MGGAGAGGMTWWKKCAGYKRECIAMIPPGKVSNLCFFCERTLRLDVASDLTRAGGIVNGKRPDSPAR